MLRLLMVAGLSLAAVAAAAADEIYMHQHGTGHILKYDTVSAALTLVGDTPLDGFCSLAAAPVPVPRAGGGFWPAGTIFAVDRDGFVFVVDKQDASLTPIGSDEDHLWNTTGLAFAPNGTLYAIRDGERDGEIYAVSTVNGTGTYLGACNLDQVDGLAVFPFEMEIWGYGVAQAGDLLGTWGGFLVHINPITFQWSFVGDVYPAAHQTLEFGPDGTLYSHGGWYTPYLYVHPLYPLQSYVIANVGYHIDGLAVIPEPGTFGALAVLVLIVRLRR